MNTKNFVIAVTLFAAAGAALADQANTPKTRTQVQAELQQAYDKGAHAYLQNLDVPQAVAVTPAAPATPVAAKVPAEVQQAQGRTRADVRAELESAYAQGEYAYLQNLDVPQAQTTYIASTKTREEVRNEAMQAGKDEQVKSSGFGG
ncbi:MAG TPA: DUF4148 domain-containing protein [Noviherbaspirillum sp.]|nr:DUF4148 domain-containing protein [Noviherbaspirillum sp.]